MAGGVHGRGVCIAGGSVCGRECAWQGACMVWGVHGGGMCGEGEGIHGRGNAW